MDVATATRVLVRLVIVVIATPQVQPLRAILRNDTSSRQQHPAGVPGAPPGGATTPSSVAKSTDLTVATRSDEETAEEERESARQAHAARAHRGGASPGGMSATADTMPMPAEAARAPITDFCPAARSCAAPRSSRAQLKAQRHPRRQPSMAASPRCCIAAPGPSWARRGAGEHLRDRVRLRPASPRMPF